MLSVWLDDASLAGRSGAAAFVATWGSWILKSVVGFLALFSVLAWRKNRVGFLPPSLPFHRPAFLVHLAAMSGFVALSAALYSRQVTALPATPAFLLWALLGLTGIAAAALAFFSPDFWRNLFRGTTLLSLYALGTVLAACLSGNSLRSLWRPLTSLTFTIVSVLVKPLLPSFISNPATATLGTARFNVEIAPECSGFEGIGLMLAFGATWLMLFRKEFRFPQALLLLPAGAIAVFFCNSLRIASLILLGNAGAEAVAVGGFHSQSGWIIFVSLALAFPLLARRIAQFSSAAPAAAAPASVSVSASVSASAADPWLWPFVAILAAGMLSTAASSNFEWLYPLRFAAALLALRHFRRKYAELDWRFGWPAALAGIAIYLLWLAMDRLLSHGNASMPPALAAASPAARTLWIAFRVIAATLTVPIAEELAFRGFLLRRLTRADFESVPFTQPSWPALLGSSLAFGLLHGGFWPAGFLAGLVFALLLRAKGRLGDAVAAHGVANALLAVNVLVLGQWQLW